MQHVGVSIFRLMRDFEIQSVHVGLVTRSKGSFGKCCNSYIISDSVVSFSSNNRQRFVDGVHLSRYTEAFLWFVDCVIES